MRNLIARFMIFSLALMVVQLKVFAQQNELDALKASVASAVPSGWSVAGAKSNESLFPTVDSLKDRYKGSLIQLVGPGRTKDVTPKNSTERKTVTVSDSAEYFLIPVWPGISRAQINADWTTAHRELMADRRMEEQGPPTGETNAYGWNDKYLLVCRGQCRLVEDVAKKLKVPKR